MEEDIDVITFDEPSKACRALHVPQAIDAQGCIGLLDAGVLERTSDGRVPMSEVRQAQAALVGPLCMHVLAVLVLSSVTGGDTTFEVNADRSHQPGLRSRQQGNGW